MKTLTLTCLLFVAACGQVPHLVVNNTGEDLGPLVDYVERQSYRSGLVVQWSWNSWDWVLYHSGTGCTGPAWVQRPSPYLPDAIPDPLTGYLLRLSRARVSATVSSQRLVWGGAATCEDFTPEARNGLRAAQQTDAPGRIYDHDELGVELR